jgi:hypothetical protein
MIRWLYFVPLWLSGLLTVVFCAFGITGLVATLLGGFNVPARG